MLCAAAPGCPVDGPHPGQGLTAGQQDPDDQQPQGDDGGAKMVRPLEASVGAGPVQAFTGEPTEATPSRMTRTRPMFGGKAGVAEGLWREGFERLRGAMERVTDDDPLGRLAALGATGSLLPMVPPTRFRRSTGW
jgi:hypothetical protein